MSRECGKTLCMWWDGEVSLVRNSTLHYRESKLPKFNGKPIMSSVVCELTDAHARSFNEKIFRRMLNSHVADKEAHNE